MGIGRQVLLDRADRCGMLRREVILLGWDLLRRAGGHGHGALTGSFLATMRHLGGSSDTR